MFENLEHWFYAIFLGVFIATAMSWLGFARWSMARIERRIQDEGHPRPAAWDGVGLRVFMYANAVLWPLNRNTGNALYEHIPAIKRYATAFDRVLSAFLLVSSGLGVLLALIGALLFDLWSE